MLRRRRPAGNPASADPINGEFSPPPPPRRPLRNRWRVRKTGRIRGRGGPPGYGVTWYPSRSVSGQGTDLGLVKQSLSVGVPAWRDGGDAMMLRVGVSDDHFSTGAILPDTPQAFPTDLWNVNLGANYLHKFDNGWTGMLMTSVGSASDQPFHGIREMTFGVGGILQVPAANERDKWTFGLMYSPSGALNFPIPILSYAWNPSDYFHLNIGLPLAMMWKPTDDLTIDLSYTPVTNVNALATYRLSDKFRVYGGYRNFTEAYFLVDRENTDDRFFGLEQRLLTGVKWDLWRNIKLDVNGGYAFDRRYGEGKNQTSSLYDEVDVSSGAFVGFQLNWKF